jgi:hypothetical protein
MVRLLGWIQQKSRVKEKKLKKKQLIFVVFALITVNSFAQTPFDRIKMSLGNVLEFTLLNVSFANFDYYDGDNALWGTILVQNTNTRMSFQAEAGVQYLILAAADSKDAVIDLKVYQGYGTGGTVINKYTEKDSIAVARFTPAGSGVHTFELINSSSEPVFISLLLLQARKNPDFSLNAMVEAMHNTEAAYQTWADGLSQTFHTGGWTLFGRNIPQGDHAGYPVNIPRGEWALIAGGERTVNNINIEVVEMRSSNSVEGKVVSKNTNTELPGDMAVFEANPAKNYYFKVINRNSRNPGAFAIGFLIQVE